METKIFKNVTIVKINFVWIKASTDNNFNFKLKNEGAENLIEGNKYDLELIDISVRSKYGTDLRYKIAKQLDKTDKKVFLKSEYYNIDLVDSCKKLGGIYDPEASCWVFESYVEDEVEELDYIYNSERVAFEITFSEGLRTLQGPLDFLGFIIAEATDRDSGARIYENVSVIEGELTSGGSRQNWRTVALCGTKIIMKLPKNLIEANKEYLDDNSILVKQL